MVGFFLVILTNITHPEMLVLLILLILLVFLMRLGFLVLFMVLVVLVRLLRVNLSGLLGEHRLLHGSSGVVFFFLSSFDDFAMAWILLLVLLLWVVFLFFLVFLTEERISLDSEPVELQQSLHVSNQVVNLLFLV